jgi:hypothetical protein
MIALNYFSATPPSPHGTAAMSPDNAIDRQALPGPAKRTPFLRRYRRMLISGVVLSLATVLVWPRDSIERRAVKRLHQIGGWAAYDGWSPRIVRTTALSNIPGLARILSINGDTIGFVAEGKAATDADIALFCQAFPQSRQVDLGATPISDAALRNVGRLPQLTLLSLGNTKVTDTGLRHLTGLANLSILELDNVPIDDAGLMELSRLPRLYRLALSGTGVTDAGLSHLHNLPNLGWIDLRDTAVSDAGVQNLQMKFPRCTIVR